MPGRSAPPESAGPRLTAGYRVEPIMTTDDTSLDAAFDRSLQQAFSPVLVQLLKALLEPTPSFMAISNFLSMDPMLAGTVLHLANAPAQGFSQKVTDIQRAAMLLGTEALYKLVISLTVQKQLKPLVPREPADLFADWRITLWGAAAAEILALRLCPAKRQAAYLAALLRDLPLLLAFCRQEAPDFLVRRGAALVSSPEGFSHEERAWGGTHPQLTHDILTVWGMPADIIEAVRLHHDYENAVSAPPLAKVLIYATRWAEAAQTPDLDPAALVAFEIGMASELELERKEMEELREACSDSFVRMLGQLGVRESTVETRYYEHTLDVLQNLHFLALEVCAESSLRRMVEVMGRKLLSFWGLDSWELTLAVPGFPACLFTCRNGTIRPEEPVDPLAAAGTPGYETIHLAAAGRRFGRLSIPAKEDRTPHVAALPLFLHVLAMNLERLRRRKAEGGASPHRRAPSNAALLDADGRLLEAGGAFLSLFGLEALPESLPARSFLLQHLGTTLPEWDAVLSGDLPGRVWLTPVRPNGKGRADTETGPVVLSLRPLVDRKNEFCLMAEGLPGLSPVQAAGLACPQFSDLLTARPSEQTFLLDAGGTIVWACPAGRALVGRNIFAVTRPKPELQGKWTARFPLGLSEPAMVEAQLLVRPDSPPVVRLRFTPLPGCGEGCRLLHISPKA